MTTNGPTTGSGRPPVPLATAVVRYGLARVGLVVVIAAVLVLAGVPLWVALLVALVAAMPLSMLMFPGLRRDLNEALAVNGERRSAHKARLRAQLRGEDQPESSGPGAGPPAAPPAA